MSALFWLIGLVLLLMVLFLLALLKPIKTGKPINNTPTTTAAPTTPALQQLLDNLANLLPEFTLNAKSGQQQRIIVSRKNLQCAIVILSDEYTKRLMNQTLIIHTNGNDKQLQDIAQNIRQHFDDIYQVD